MSIEKEFKHGVVYKILYNFYGYNIKIILIIKFKISEGITITISITSSEDITTRCF